MALELEKINRGNQPTQDGAGTDDAWTFTGKINRNFEELEKPENASSRKVGTGNDEVPLSKDLAKAPAVIDGLRRSVEAASGGKMTVHYTAKGQASYFFIQPAFLASDVDPNLPNELHPMFVAGEENKKERHIGAFQGVVINGELVSTPCADPGASRNFDSFASAARACGPGFGLMTNADWAGIGAWCRANDFYPRGNSNFGQDRHRAFETGTRQDSGIAGDGSGSARTLTGSGPTSWRHNNDMIGISDLCGNVWEWAPGMRIVDGEIHIIKDNDAALDVTDFGASSSAWRAIDASNGDLVAPGHSRAIKLASSGSADYTIVASSGSDFKTLTANAIGPAALTMLKLHGMFPLGNDIGDDRLSFNLKGERVPFRGGYWYPSNRSGVFTVNLVYARSVTATLFGARPAFTV